MCLSYLLHGNKDKKIFPLASWEKIVVPKDLGGRGLNFLVSLFQIFSIQVVLEAPIQSKPLDKSYNSKIHSSTIHIGLN